MKSKDGLFIVVYVGVQELSSANAREHLLNITNFVQKNITDKYNDINTIIIPSFSEDKSFLVLDCINPKLMSGKQYTEVKNKIDLIDIEIKSFLDGTRSVIDTPDGFLDDDDDGEEDTSFLDDL